MVFTSVRKPPMTQTAEIPVKTDLRSPWITLFSDAESKMARPRVAVSASHHYKSPVEDEVAPLSHPRVPVESRAL